MVLCERESEKTDGRQSLRTEALLGSGLRDAMAHEAETHDTDRRDAVWLRGEQAAAARREQSARARRRGEPQRHGSSTRFDDYDD